MCEAKICFCETASIFWFCEFFLLCKYDVAFTEFTMFATFANYFPMKCNKNSGSCRQSLMQNCFVWVKQLTLCGIQEEYLNLPSSTKSCSGTGSRSSCSLSSPVTSLPVLCRINSGRLTWKVLTMDEALSDTPFVTFNHKMNFTMTLSCDLAMLQ